MQAGANLQILYRISEEAVRPTSSVDELLKRILDLTLESLGADRGCMLVADSKTDQITPRVVSHRPQVDVNQRMPISTSIVEYVISHGHGVRTSDAQHDSRFDGGASIAKSGIREAMCVPMHGRYELMGVIYVDTTVSAPHLQSPNTSRFNDQQLRLLLAIGRQSALAIENFRYQDALVTAERLGAVGGDDRDLRRPAGNRFLDRGVDQRAVEVGQELLRDDARGRPHTRTASSGDDHGFLERGVRHQGSL